MRTIKHILALVVFALAASSLIAKEEPWSIRVIVYLDERLCDGSALLMHIEPRASEPLRVPIDSSEFIDVTWDIPPLEAGEHTFHVQEVSCSGRLGQIGRLEFNSGSEQSLRQVYVAVTFARGNPNLEYIELDTEWSADKLLSIDKKDREAILNNRSKVEFQRCEFNYAHAYDEYFADNRWEAFDLGDRFEWPDAEEKLQPGGSVTLKRTGPEIVVWRKKPPALVHPTAKRWVIPAQPRLKHFVVLGEPARIPPDLPGCDTYVLELPTTEEDPPVKIWGLEP